MKLNFDISSIEYNIIHSILVEYLNDEYKVWVFGSRAKNQAKYNSDLDLALEYKTKIDHKILRRLKIEFEESKLAYKVDILDINSISDEFKKIIKKDMVLFPLKFLEKTPKLRFKEFRGEWEEKSLGKILTFKNGINADKEQYGKGYKFINVLDIINNTVIRHDDIIGFVNVTKEVFEKNKVEYGDILFQRSSEIREEAGQSNVYLDKNTPATFGGFVIRGQKLIDYVPEFMNYMLKTSHSRKEITQKSNGSTRYNVGQDTLSKVNVFIPKLNEQEKIASFLTSIDTKIEQLAKKDELLQQYKKGLMQKIFSGEIRFTSDNGKEFLKWEEKRISDIFEVTRGYVLAVNKMSEIKTNEYKYPVYSSQTKNKGLTGYFNEYLYENSITWTTDGANAGEVNFRKGKFYCTNVCGVLKSDKGYANECIAQILNSVSKRYVSYVGNPKLMNNTMSSIKIKIPSSIEEQNKIADFLSSIDQKIEQNKKAFEETEEFKKALLQQMFV